MPEDQKYSFRFTPTRSWLSSTKSVKRKRKKVIDDDGFDEEDLQTIQSRSGLAELLPENARQRHVAGLSANEEIPGNDFPHRPQHYGSERGVYIAPSRMQKELSTLNPPLLDHVQRYKHLGGTRSSLKQQHINTLYNIVHRCLLERDHVRAERAFRLLLKTETIGKLPDLRKKNLWGIGAEILLHRKGQTSSTSESIGAERKQFFDKDGLEEVRIYFEKLIIQYPYRKEHPNAISSAQMYPILFGFWIASIDTKYQVALDSVEREHLTTEDVGGSAYADEVDSIKQSTLASAREVDYRLDEVLRYPPHSDGPILWDLKGHVCLWIEDLSKPYQEQEQSQRFRKRNEPAARHHPILSHSAESAFSKARLLRSHQESTSQSMEIYDSDVS